MIEIDAHTGSLPLTKFGNHTHTLHVYALAYKTYHTHTYNVHVSLDMLHAKI